MRYYFAPLEGITDGVYRRTHHSFYPGLDRYYMPFLSPTMHRCLTRREERELPLAQALGYRAIPQILTKNAADFRWAAEVCAQRGYEEVNLNLGCPSGTVVAKGKGSGMLRDGDGLDAFLEEIFRDPPIPISVKTRLGLETGEEFPRLLEIFNRYPIRELTLHPRTRSDLYKGPVRMEWVDHAVKNSKNPLCFNGNLTTLEEIQAFSQAYPQVEAVMLGRGLIADPGMLSGPFSLTTLEAFHDRLLEEYIAAFGSERNALCRMKENWRYWLRRFENSDKLGKRLRKTTDPAEYRRLAKEIFHICTPAPHLLADW